MASDIVKRMQAIRLNDLEDGRSQLQNRHMTTNDTIVENNRMTALTHAVALRANESIAKEGFKTVRLSLGKISDDEGWDGFIKLVLVAGGIGLLGYLAWGIIKAIREQPQQVANGISEVIKSVKATK